MVQNGADVEGGRNEYSSLSQGHERSCGELTPHPTPWLTRVYECSPLFLKDGYHFSDFICDVRVAYVYHYMKNNLIRKIAMVQTVHLATCAIFNMAAYVFVLPLLRKCKGREESVISDLYARIWADPNMSSTMRMLEFLNFLLSMTGLEHHSVLIAWHGTLYQDHKPEFKALERRLDKWAAWLKFYECGIQTPLQVTVLAIQLYIGEEVHNSQKISVATSTISFALSSLGDVIASIVEDPDNPGYSPENAQDLDEKNWAAIDNFWSCDSDCPWTFLQGAIDLVLVGNVGATIWIWLQFESVWTKSFWVCIVFVMFAMHIVAHADYLGRNRRQLKHLLGHKIIAVVNRGAFVMLLSFISPFAFRLYNPISKKQGGFPHLSSLCFYLLILIGYSVALWWDHFAINTSALLAGGSLSFVGFASALWWTKQDIIEIQESTNAEHRRCVPDITKIFSRVMFLCLFLALGVSIYLPFQVHIREPCMANFFIEEFGRPIGGEYYQAGIHNRKPYFKKRGDILDSEPVIYWVPRTDVEFGHSKWVIGVCQQPFEPSFNRSRISGWYMLEFAISALSESPRPVCDPHMQKHSNDDQTCLAYTTNHSLPSTNNHTGIPALWQKLDRHTGAYRPEAIRIRSPTHYNRITLTGMDRASLANIPHLVLGEYKVDDMNGFNSIFGTDFGTDGGKRASTEHFREGFPVFKQRLGWNSTMSVDSQYWQSYYLFVFNGKWCIDKHFPGPGNADSFYPVVQVHGDLLSNIRNHSEFLLSGHHAIGFRGSCDSTCRGCFGDNVQQCISCMSFQDGNSCVFRCPVGKHPEHRAGSEANISVCMINKCNCSHGIDAQGTHCLHHGGLACKSCDDGYFEPPQCALKRCTCNHGVGEKGKSCPRNGMENCAYCESDAYYKHGSRCVLKMCTCKNGFGEIGKSCPQNGKEQCKSCEKNYQKVARNCVAYPCVTGNGAKCKICKPESLRTGDNQCQKCNSGYDLLSETSVCEAYRCATGNGAKCKICEPQPSRTGDNQCQECNSGYELLSKTSVCEAKCQSHFHRSNGSQCVLDEGYHFQSDAHSNKLGKAIRPNMCICKHGAAAVGKKCPNHGQPLCEKCNGDFRLANSSAQCIPKPGYHMVNGAVQENVCNCSLGRQAIGPACPVNNEHGCLACDAFAHLANGTRLCVADPGYHVVNDSIRENNCNCEHGIPRRGRECTVDGGKHCKSCNQHGEFLGGSANSGVCIAKKGYFFDPARGLFRVKVCNCDNGAPALAEDCPKNGKYLCHICPRHMEVKDGRCVPKEGFHVSANGVVATSCKCDHGKPAYGRGCPKQGVTKCILCFHPFKLSGEHCRIMPGYHIEGYMATPNTCTCNHGVPATTNDCLSDKAPKCITCDEFFHLTESGRACILEKGYHLANGQARQNVCKCLHGIGERGKTCHIHGAALCKACWVSYEFDEGSCVLPPGFHTDWAGRVVQNVCICIHGSPALGPECPVNGAHKCMACPVANNFQLIGGNCLPKDGYHLVYGNAVENECTCPNGLPLRGKDCPKNNAYGCKSSGHLTTGGQ